MKTPHSILPKALRRSGPRRLRWTVEKTPRRRAVPLSVSQMARLQRSLAERRQRLARITKRAIGR